MQNNKASLATIDLNALALVTGGLTPDPPPSFGLGGSTSQQIWPKLRATDRNNPKVRRGSVICNDESGEQQCTVFPE